MFARRPWERELPSWYPPIGKYDTILKRLRHLGLYRDEHLVGLYPVSFPGPQPHSQPPASFPGPQSHSKAPSLIPRSPSLVFRPPASFPGFPRSLVCVQYNKCLIVNANRRTKMGEAWERGYKYTNMDKQPTQLKLQFVNFLSVHIVSWHSYVNIFLMSILLLFTFCYIP